MRRPRVERLGRPIVRLGEVGSTNDVAELLAAAGVAEGALVVADRQTAGRGRLGRRWLSPHGGLWCSVLLRPVGGPSRGLLSLAVGVAVAEAAEMAAGVRTGLKWPNDVLVEGRKVAGVLIEAAGGAVIVGVGVNVTVPADALPNDIDPAATSLHLASVRPVDRDRVLVALVDRLTAWYQTWYAGGEQVLDAWRRRDVTTGGPVVVSVWGETLAGVADGIDGDGALRVRLSTGEVWRVVAGDVRVRVRKAPGC
jgi:BirA family biotin operon repressor/biotin-[acetyl-CoA-carboxylase] ligase